MPAYSRLKARLCDQIHPLSDLVAQIVLQSYITNEAERLLKIDEQIQIAVILLFASHERAEDADLFDLKPMPKDWLLVSKNTLDLLKGFHLFLGTTKGRIVNKYDERLIFRLVIKIAVRNGQAVFSACCSLSIPSSPVSPRILVRCLRMRGRSLQGPHACTCPRPCARMWAPARLGGPPSGRAR
jgi:hypothetical protein